MSYSITLDFEDDGYHAVCDSTDCGDRVPQYRIMLGTYIRFACETCLTQLLLEPMSRG